MTLGRENDNSMHFLGFFVPTWLVGKLGKLHAPTNVQCVALVKLGRLLYSEPGSQNFVHSWVCRRKKEP